MVSKKNVSSKKSFETRYPNFSTVLMVETYLKKNSDMPIKISKLKESLPKKVMHSTLKLVLEYLFISGKIIYGPRGIQWVYKVPSYLKDIKKDTLEI